MTYGEVGQVRLAIQREQRPRLAQVPRNGDNRIVRATCCGHAPLHAHRFDVRYATGPGSPKCLHVHWRDMTGAGARMSPDSAAALSAEDGARGDTSTLGGWSRSSHSLTDRSPA